MSDENKKLVARWFEEVWNQKRSEAIDELFAADGRSWGSPDPWTPLEGPAALRQYHAQLCGAFPDVHLRVHDLVAEGEYVVARWTAEMTHTGDHLGPKATGKRIAVPGMSMVKVRNGQLYEGWNAADFTGMMASLNS